MMAAASVLAVSTGCADTDIAQYLVEKPQSIASMEYLDGYDVLKNYVDRTENPDFKLGCGVAASDFNNLGVVYRMTCSNFDEMTAGNAMKYNACVASDGSMDFSTVTNFVETAQAAGITIYGHTLCWHSQQQNEYLNGLIADREVEVDPDAAVEVEDGYVDYSTYTSFPYYVMGYEPYWEDGCMCSSYPGSWYQYYAADNITTTAGGTYKVTLMIQGSTDDGSLTVQMGNWSPGTVTNTLYFDTEMKEQSVELTNVPSTTSFVVLQPGTYSGDIKIKWLKVTHSEAPSVSYWTDLLTNGDAEDSDVSCFYATEQGDGPHAATIGEAGTGSDGVGHAFVVQSGDNPPQTYSTQFFVQVPQQLKEGDNYRFTMKYRAEKAASSETQAHNGPGNYVYWQMLSYNPSFTTEWQETTWTGTISSSQAGSSGMNTIAFNLSVLAEANTYYFDDLKFELEGSGNTIPLTDEEKADTLTWAMDQWIAGMMGACSGYVTSWDVVNEPLSGADYDGDGKFDLQSSELSDDPDNNFYWQDYLGENYVRIPIQLARQYFAESGGNASDLKLFINDYNLESWWDDNGKLRSLIKWIEQWESDGTTVIDGIGTQMHVSYILDADGQAAQEEAIVNMFELLASTGKLIKISELDMGIVEKAFGTGIPTEDVTEEQQKLMADFYTFIIQKYFEIIPVAQQYGITQWAATDSPANSSWRGGEPIGLWDENYNRKHTYAGFAAGLSGE